MLLAEDTILVKRYRIDGLLAHSGTAAIYRAFDTDLSAPVAIKENFFPTPERIAQFKQEAVVLARLRHPALPRVIHHFRAGNKQYLVMDFIEGEDLEEIVKKRRQPLPESEALDYIIQVCQAVSYLHRQSPPIIHRDIRPQNIKITPGGQAVLVGFGLAKQVSGQSGPTEAGARGGMPDFSPPKQYGRGRMTPASNIFSLGATLYALLAGKAPPNSASLRAGGEQFDPPHKVNPKLSRQVSQAIMDAMKIDPVDRPQSVAAWQKELEAIVESAPWPDSGEDPILSLDTTPVKDKDKKLPDASLQQPVAGPTYWLVDATGLGYQIGAKPLVIGRHANAGVVVEDLNVAPYQAQVRTDGRRCLVQDKGSPDGTFLNGLRLGSEWYPLNPGDLLTVGSVRFHLTGTQPAKLAPPKPKPARPLPGSAAGSVTPLPVPTVQLPAPAAKSGLRRLLTALVLLFLLGLIGIVVFDLSIDPTALSLLSSLFSTGDKTAVSQTQPVEVGTGQMTVQARADAESTRQAQQDVDASPTDLKQAAATTQETATGTTAPEPGPASGNTATPPRQPPTATSTDTPSQRPPTTTPTGISTRAVPAASGPTVIPLNSEATIALIGVREVTDVDINPKNPREVYALVKGDGIYKSSNGGDGPWARMKLDASGVVAFVVDPANPARLYAPTWNAVLKSTDGGNTWQAKTNGLLSNQTVDVLVIGSTNPNTLYAGVGETLVVSTDGGENWSSLGYGAGLGLARFYEIVIDPFNSDIIYVGGLAAAIYKSTDAGRTFIPAPVNTGQGAYGLTAHPTRRDVYLAGINSSEAAIVKTENSWDFRSVSDGLVFGGADSAYSAITYAPSNPNIVYAGSGYEDNRYAKGIFKSTDGGEHWTNISHGLSINRDFGLPYYVKSIAVHPAEPDIVFAATGGGLFKSVDGGINWGLQ